MPNPPPKTAKGTLHLLRNKNNPDPNNRKVFEWGGKSWFTPGNQWGTSWSLMETLGWRYVGPVEQEPHHGR